MLVMKLLITEESSRMIQLTLLKDQEKGGRGRDNGEPDAQKKAHVKRQKEASRLQAKERDLRRNQLCSALVLDLLSPEA